MKNDSTFIRKPSDSPKQPRSAVQRVVYTDSNWHSECSTGNTSQDDGGTNAHYASAAAEKKLRCCLMSGSYVMRCHQFRIHLMRA